MSHSEFAARTFGLDPSPPPAPETVDLPMPAAGKSLAVIGPSGAGKTLALRRLLEQHPEAREVSRLRCEDLDTPVLDLFDIDALSERVMRVLAQVGLADGRLWSLKAGQLSAGECRRLEIALALMHEGALVIDEFDAHLDATTSCLLAQNLHRLARNRALVVTTHRPESLACLQPARVIEIDRGVRDLPAPAHADMLDAIQLVRGRRRDYDAFARWHYLGPGRPGPTSNVWLALHAGRPVGIVMFGYPHLLLGARKQCLPVFAPAKIRRHGAGELNANVRLLQRVVVEPRWRGIGLARKLIRHGLANLDVSTVECIAQMGAFSGFLTSAGFERAGEVRPPEPVRRLLEFMRQHNIDDATLLNPDRRAEVLDSLDQQARATLQRRLSAVVRSRVETGFGSLRGNFELREPILRKALSRLHARPGYYLWRRP